MTAAQKLVLNYFRAKIHLLNAINPQLAAASAFRLFTKPARYKPKKEPRIFKHAQPLRLPNQQGEMHGYKWTPEKNTRGKLLIAHGFGGNCRSFDRYISPALKMGFEVYAFDAPGHGNSPGRQLNINLYRWFLEDVIKHHGPFDASFAHSLGAISWLLATQHLQPSHYCRSALVAAYISAEHSIDYFAQLLQMPAKLKALFTQYLVNQAGNSMHYYNLSRIVQEVKQPLLWAHDLSDDRTPFKHAAHLQELQIPHLKFFLTNGLGHTAIYKDNSVKKAVLAFWENRAD